LKTDSNSSSPASTGSGGSDQQPASGAGWRVWGDEAQDPIRPLSREQVVQMGLDRPAVSVWRVLLWQALTGAGLAVLLALVDRPWGWSALYGAAAVVLPGLVFARGLTGRLSSINAGTAVAGFFVWEFVKIGLTLAMLLAAPRLIGDLSWPALLAGLVVTMKVVWLSVWMHSRRGQVSGANWKNRQ
jgi:ATP synthase protein I